jgi:predicted dehydrogenase
LRDGPYGRCVYACDNDVADHQVVTIEFDSGVTATLTMSAFTPYGRRRTRIMGSRGFLEGDGHQVTVTDYVTGQAEPVAVDGPGQAAAGGGHGGGDFGVIGAFADAVASGDRSLICTGPRESLDSHRMAFAAERSRLTGLRVELSEQRSAPG